MRTSSPSLTVKLDPTNPGQYFACCALLALADRLWPHPTSGPVEGWFARDDQSFHIHGPGTLAELIQAISQARLEMLDAEDRYSTGLKLQLNAPGQSVINIDWWQHDAFDAKDFKIWAGTMESYGIAYALQQAMRGTEFQSPDLFNIGMVVPNPENPKDKKEPYYYDARRAPNAHSRDVGFSPNDLGASTIAHPAVEFLCLIGLQFARPRSTRQKRIYDYFQWHEPLPANLLSAASCGALELADQTSYRFENWFRTGQRKHKAFRAAVRLP